MLYPSLLSLYYSVLDWEGGPVSRAPFVGLDNFREVFDDPVVVRRARQQRARALSELGVSASDRPDPGLHARPPAARRARLPLPLLHPGHPARRDAGAALALHLLRQRVRTAQQRPARGRAGRSWIQRWLSADGIVQWTTSFPAAWQFIGFFMVIFLAALAGIPEEYYEAAAIDGAERLAPARRHHPARASNRSTSRP